MLASKYLASYFILWCALFEVSSAAIVRRRIEEVQPGAPAAAPAAAGAGGLPSSSPVQHTYAPPSCTPLENHGSHSTIEIGVGTPPQMLDVIADTGSTNLIVTSCICHQHACGNTQASCFTGVNVSTSFELELDKTKNPKMMQFTFGSGEVFAAVASDVVAIGQIQAKMNNSLLLMVDHKLDVDLPSLEGILGLGIPASTVGGAASKGPMSEMKSWLEQAQVPRFSMCLNDDGRAGVLRVSTNEQLNALQNVGQMHWALEFRGVSAGTDDPGHATFCSPGDKPPGAVTACGMIPDSGTTLIMGPQHHILALTKQICDEWHACKVARDARAKQSKEIGSPSAKPGLGDSIREMMGRWGIPVPEALKGAQLTPEQEIALDSYHAFQNLVHDCASWLTPDSNIDELLPSIFFHVAGSEGRTASLEMRPSLYIVATSEKNCLPFFGAYDYSTPQNGPVWIIGTPLFYEYQVHFDTLGKGSLAFQQTNCGTCVDGKIMSLVGQKSSLRKRTTGLSSLRQMKNKIRMPRYNTSLPL
eukprot:TRINITY_DN10812_c0_g1_i1.p1 TRINITY_DN10812_c0_g1~~TRINITY_DN10812_c0_g1_i1.p1  ORF type:complete len:530 (-),score=90.80 TRINITY_DN10812_c0_g1_i1:67-1656(-)